MMSNMSSGLTIETKLILGHSGAASIRTPRIVTQPEIETELSEGIPEIELLSSSSELSVDTFLAEKISPSSYLCSDLECNPLAYQD